MKKRLPSRRITLPPDIGEQLDPYVELFEREIVPLVRTRRQSVDRGSLDEFWTRIRRFERRKGKKLHPVLVYTGLMLCCYYLNVVPARRGSGFSARFVAWTRELIREAYRTSEWDSLIFIIGR